MKLKKLFNGMYVKMSKVKENEMDVIAKRNERLNQIHQDINLVQCLNGDEITPFVAIPKFDHFDYENPSELLAITSCTIESDLNDNSDQSFSTKSIKLFRNQSFYKRALDQMMDGVLKVCWEDELKKDPPKPLCLQQTSDESQFTELELAQVHQYYEKLAKQRDDRKLYINQLFDEKNALESSIDHQIRKLNRCVENIIKTKVKAQFAISSEQLKILMCVRDHLRLKVLGEKERNIA